MNDPIRHPLTRARLERRWSQAELARRIRQAALRRGFRSGADRQRIWKWENSYSVPDADSRLLLADVFEIDPGAEVWSHWPVGADLAPPIGPQSAVPVLREALRRSMDRRAFLSYSTAAATGLAHQWVVTEPQAFAAVFDGKPVDAALVETLEQTGAGMTGLVTEQRQHTRRLLDAHLVTVTDLIDGRNYSPAIGIRLHDLAARLALTVGWHRFDQGEHASADRFWRGALHSAHASGDRDLGAGVLADLAYQAGWLHQPGVAADILERALSRATHPTARALLQLRLARARATLGDGRACRRSLRLSELSLSTAADTPPPAWCAWMSPADLLVDSGQCLLDLEQPSRAHQLIDEGMRLLPAARDKTRGVFLSYEADSRLHAGQVDRAAAAARESLLLAHRIGAPRCVELVRGLLPAFAPYGTVEGVPELLELAR